MHKSIVLIASCNLSIKSFLGRSLCNGYLLLFAESTQATWKQIGENGASLVVLDENLPELGGLRLLRLLKIAYPQIPVIFTSENLSYEGCLQAFRYGARDCFSKPYDFELLSKKAEIILRSLSEDNHLGKNYFMADHKNDLSLEERKILEEISSRNGNDGIYKAIKYIQKNFQEKISKDQVAEIACLSSSHFSRVFKKRVGYSFTEYLIATRIEKAKEFLREQDLNITEVCHASGFHNLSYFERTFSKAVGYSPGAYRKGMRCKAIDSRAEIRIPSPQA